MNVEHLNELIAVEKNYWWHVSKRAIVTDLMKLFRPPPAYLLEGGIGGGANLLFWQSVGYKVSGFDILPEAVQHCHSMGLDKVFVHNITDEWPASYSSIDIVILLDVLEHIQDPVDVLNHAAKFLNEEGIIIVTVPALPFLMGPWDHMLSHYRRYSRKLLQEDAQKAGLDVSWISYWNSYSLPGAIVVRLLDKFSKKQPSAKFPAVSRLLNRILITIGDVERWIMSISPIPLGVSLVAVLKHRKAITE